jgi:hypothetical protein
VPEAFTPLLASTAIIGGGDRLYDRRGRDSRSER